MIRVVGVDPSARSTGVALPNGDLCTIRPPNQASGPGRTRLIAADISRLTVTHQAQLLVIEGPALHGPGPAGKDTLARVRGAIEAWVDELGVPIVEVAPSRLKRWATGHGNADKDAMIAAARQLRYRPRNDDEADAALLRSIGVHAYNGLGAAEDVTSYRLEVIADITWPVIGHVATNGHDWRRP